MNSPTIDKHGTKRWHNKKGKLHRINGPAVEDSNGGKSWWISGKIYGKQEYFTELEKHISKEEIFILRLKYE